jgi:hypothetical protein
VAHWSRSARTCQTACGLAAVSAVCSCAHIPELLVVAGSAAGWTPAGLDSAPGLDVVTGSLGQGLPVGVGIALATNRLDQLLSRIWVLCGDGEMAEGSMWEAAQYAGFMGLDNLIAVVDVNRLGQYGETMLAWDLSAYAGRLKTFACRAVEVEGMSTVRDSKEGQGPVLLFTSVEWAAFLRDEQRRVQLGRTTSLVLGPRHEGILGVVGGADLRRERGYRG